MAQRHRLDARRQGASKHFLGRPAEIPNQSHRLPNAENPVGHIDFPPEEPLACRAGEVVVVVVPTFPRRDDRQQQWFRELSLVA